MKKKIDLVAKDIIAKGVTTHLMYNQKVLKQKWKSKKKKKKEKNATKPLSILLHLTEQRSRSDQGNSVLSMRLNLAMYNE